MQGCQAKPCMFLSSCIRCNKLQLKFVKNGLTPALGETPTGHFRCRTQLSPLLATCCSHCRPGSKRMSLCTPFPANSRARSVCGPPAIRSKCAPPAACLRPRAVQDQVTRLRCRVSQADREQTLSKSDRGRRVDKVVQLIKHVDALVPFDPETFNAALTVW